MQERLVSRAAHLSQSKAERQVDAPGLRGVCHAESAIFTGKQGRHSGSTGGSDASECQFPGPSLMLGIFSAALQAVADRARAAGNCHIIRSLLRVLPILGSKSQTGVSMYVKLVSICQYPYGERLNQKKKKKKTPPQTEPQFTGAGLYIPWLKFADILLVLKVQNND